MRKIIACVLLSLCVAGCGATSDSSAPVEKKSIVVPTLYNGEETWNITRSEIDELLPDGGWRGYDVETNTFVDLETYSDDIGDPRYSYKRSENVVESYSFNKNDFCLDYILVSFGEKSNYQQDEIIENLSKEYGATMTFSENDDGIYAEWEDDKTYIFLEGSGDRGFLLRYFSERAWNKIHGT